MYDTAWIIQESQLSGTDHNMLRVAAWSVCAPHKYMELENDHEVHIPQTGH